MNIVSFNQKDQQVMISSAYGIDQSMVFKFERFGVNGVFSLAEVYIIPFSEKITEEELTVDRRIINPITDWISPYWISAKDNVDLPSNGNKLTGGNHGTINGTGDPTADFVDLMMFLDDQPVLDNLENLAIEQPIKLVTTNMVEASNTHINYPRAVLEEKVTYLISDNKIKVDVAFQAKEQVYVIEYSGLQTNSEYYDQFMIPNSQLSGFFDTGDETYTSGPHEKFGLANTLMLNKKNTTDWLIVTLNHNKLFDLAMDQELILVADKSYFRQIYHTNFEMQSGDKFWFSGTYSFVNSDHYLSTEVEG